jgi:type 2 lantibiotic biosynthesis protein LanM
VSREDGFGAPEWSAALRLDERAQCAGAPAAPLDLEAMPWAKSRLQTWREVFPDEETFAGRLADLGLDAGSLTGLLAEPASSLAARWGGVPAWLSWLRAAEARHAEAPLDLPPGVAGRAIGGFLELLRPAYLAARREFSERFAALRIPPDVVASELARTAFAERLGQRWLWMIDRTLVLEMHASAMLDPLPGDTPRERFTSFIERLGDRRTARAILQEYPVLARQTIERASLERDAMLEFFGQLRDDRAALQRTFFGARDPGALVSLGRAMGDSHRGARVVRVLRFESGEAIVHKPHALATDVCFQHLLAWLTARGLEPAPRTVGVLDRGTHGWVEFAAAAPCSDESAVVRHVERLGGLLAILHVLATVDVHFENLVGAGEHPVCVDLETLMHPSPAWAQPSGCREERLISSVLDASVLRVGMLPFPGGGPDWSGLGSAEGQLSDESVLEWEHEGRDDMRAVRGRVKLAGGENRPRLGDREVEISEHLGAFGAGFDRAWDVLERERDALWAADGPMARLAAAPTRVVLRPTHVYGFLLEESWHPDLLRDALDREAHFDGLWRAHAAPGLRPAIAHERADLWRGDVPYFQSTAASALVRDSLGRAVDHAQEASGWALARRRSAAMNGHERLRQNWLARTALATRMLHRDQAGWLEYELPGAAPLAGPARRAACLAAAREVGEWFERMAHRDGDALAWITLDYREQRWALSPSAEDVYAGAPGIAWFLATLADRTGEARFARLATDAMRTLLARLTVVPTGEGGPGLFQGWAGLVHVLAHLAAIQDETAWLADAQRLLPRVAARLEEDRDFDVVSGAAGAVAALRALHRASGGADALALARRAGEHLLAHAQAGPEGCAWTTRFAHEGPARGFAHGTAGIGAALAGLARDTGDARFARCAVAALAFERSALATPGGGGEPAVGAPVSARQAIDHAVSTSWCHGIPGIALALCATPEAGRDAAWRGDLSACAALTETRGFGKNHCLCHGDLGNLDVLLTVAETLGDRALSARAEHLGDRIVAGIRRDGWRCGTVGGVETPALMNGLAGIGYGLLRFAERDRVPSVLALEAPLQRPR